MSWWSMSIACPLVSRLQRAFGENARDVALIIRGRLDAAGRIDHGLYRCRDAFECVRGYRASDQDIGGPTGIDRRLGEAAQSQATLAAFVFITERHHRRDARDGKIAAPARDL